ncbi:MAG: ATP-binding protein [bacterium]|nr:ATP-binding protein [bacterium]
MATGLSIPPHEWLSGWISVLLKRNQEEGIKYLFVLFALVALLACLFTIVSYEYILRDYHQRNQALEELLHNLDDISTELSRQSLVDHDNYYALLLGWGEPDNGYHESIEFLNSKFSWGFTPEYNEEIDSLILTFMSLDRLFEETRETAVNSPDIAVSGIYQKAQFKKHFQLTLELQEKQSHLESLGRKSNEEVVRNAGESFQDARQITLIIVGIGLLTLIIIAAVAFRRISLQVRSILKSKQEAQAANASKSVFLANMSHEVRTPINGIIGMAELLSESDLDQRQKENVDTILMSSRHLVRIVNEILDISRIEAGRMKINPVATNLKAEVEKVIQIIHSKASDKNVTLTLQYKDTVERLLHLDDTRIRQVLLNIIDNAIKFSPTNSEVTVKVDVKRIASEQSALLKFTIADQGIGIRPEKIGHVMKMFSQEDESTTRQFGGTGLGLTISKQLVELAGGTLEISSNKGEGTKVTINMTVPVFEEQTLPGCDSNSQQMIFAPNHQSTNSEQVGLGAPPGEEASSVPHQQLSVLLVEDNLVNQKVTSRMLESLGYQVDTAIDGHDGVAKHVKGNYCFILMDCQMPNLDGYDATRQIRSLSDKNQIPIIAVTAHALDGDKEKCLAAGMNGYIAKPVSKSTLTEEIARVLKLSI